jgi:uncharacterized protein DUF2334
MFFCLRDDDTSFFTSPENLEQAYGELTKWGPVSLAVIPFCRAGTSKGVPEKYRARWSIHPLHENRSLVDYLRAAVSQGRFEIMLHGYHHDERTGRGEFSNGGDNLFQKVVAGRKYLEDLLTTRIRVFVPPRNCIGRDGLRAIVREGLNLGGTAGVRAGWPPLSQKTWKIWLELRKRRRSGAPGIPWILDLEDHREIPGNPVTPISSFEKNKAVFNAALAVGGVFCAATHYWERGSASMNPADPPVGEHLRLLIELARSDSRVSWRSVGDVAGDRDSALA